MKKLALALVASSFALSANAADALAEGTVFTTAATIIAPIALLVAVTIIAEDNNAPTSTTP